MSAMQFAQLLLVVIFSVKFARNLTESVNGRKAKPADGMTGVTASVIAAAAHAWTLYASSALSTIF